MNDSFLYLDSSVMVALASEDPERSQKIRGIMENYAQIGSSEVSVVECQAGIAWQTATKKDFKADIEQNMNRLLVEATLYSIDSLVLGHARSLVKRHRVSIGLRTLDAIHIATANLIQQSMQGSGKNLEYLTADRRQHEAFTTEGFVGNLI